MSRALFIVVGLIGASPAVLLCDGLIAQGIIAGVAAVALGITAVSLRPGETEFLVSTIRPTVPLAAAPAVWVLFQVLPANVLAHPIWISAQTALGSPIAGTVSVDPGAGVVALGHYLSMVAVALVAAAVAVDRRRAEWILFALTGATSAMALTILFGGFFLPAVTTAFAGAQAVDGVGLGVIVASAACVRTVERYETRRSSPQRSVSALLWTLVACALALAICAGALIIVASRAVLVAGGCGLAAFAGLMIIRRFGLGPWGTAAMVVPALSLAALLAASQPVDRGTNVTLTFAAGSASAGKALSKRVLDDAPIVGSGAGTFAALAPIYREIDDPPDASMASTAAASLAIELGQPMLWLIAMATIASILILSRASLRRGRDSFYPAMGGACFLTVFLLTFINAGLLGSGFDLVVAAVLGLAVAQSRSRAIQF